MKLTENKINLIENRVDAIATDLPVIMVFCHGASDDREKCTKKAKSEYIQKHGKIPNESPWPVIVNVFGVQSKDGREL